MSVLLFLLGLAIALGSNFVVKAFSDWVREKSQVPPKPNYPRVPSWVLGTFERLLAFVVVAFNIPQAGTIFIAWIAAKLAANWQRRDAKTDDREAAIIRASTFIALMSGVLSLALGSLGGYIARCGLQ